MAHDSGNWNARGDWDDQQPPFTPDELRRAFDLRVEYGPSPEVIHQLGRTDHCPHQPICASVQDCVEKIAWYLRHQGAIEADA